ncbi:hypothetical protein B0H14DRAFT_2621746 [Mycena olivaceomarginata]|nr:hypothetical protein B0H14DRAFT_2621746 [Mycena olivaceomarginata]
MTSATKKVSPFDFLIWPRKKGHYGFDPICPKWGDMSGSSLRHITTFAPTKVGTQLTAWEYNREPFRSMTWTSALNPLDYWKPLARDSNVKILGALAIKVFSIMPSEICDERTASRLGRFNSARTASMAPDSLVECAKLYDYYTYAPDAPEDIAAIRSAPTVMDLLSRSCGSTHPDPYDLSEADRCPLDAPFVMRSISRFEISDYVKLDSPGLSELILVLRLLA